MPAQRLQPLRYGALGVPLAFAQLPLYVNVPSFYAAAGLGLGTIGAILLATRLADTVIDPFLGALSDRLPRARTLLMALAAPVLMAAFYGLFAPPPHVTALWLLAWLVPVFASFSLIAINYYALGVGLAASPHDNTILAVWREGGMLLGVLTASVLPTLLQKYFSILQSYRLFALAFAVLLALGAAVTLSLHPSGAPRAKPSRRLSVFALLADARLRWIFLIVFANGIPAAITATLFLFFVGDVLGAGGQGGAMLAVYFLSAVAGMPAWSALSRRAGKAKSLFAAMLASIAAFVWAFFLGHGDVVQFYVICFVSGLSLGADVVLLPALLADRLGENPQTSGAGFGWWNFLNKLTLALAAGIALPLLAAGGYRPGHAGALTLLSFCYALLPCLFKALAAVLLFFSPLHVRGPVLAEH